MTIRAILPMLLSLCMCGCGTVLNLVAVEDEGAGIFAQGNQTAPKMVYGGVAIDGVSGAEWMNQGDTLLGLYVWCIDLPLSVAGDTLTLPYTIASNVGNPVPDSDRTKGSLASFGKKLKDNGSSLVRSLPSWADLRDSAYDEEPSKTEIVH